MKLRRKNGSAGPGYPAFDDYVKNRDRYLRGISLGAGALLASGAMALAGEQGTSPDKACPVESIKPGAEEEVRLLGEVAAPTKPEPAKPDKAKPMPTVAPPVVIDGDMVAPAPPPKTRGEPPPAKPHPAPVAPVVAPPPPPPPGIPPPPQPPEEGETEQDPESGEVEPEEAAATPQDPPRLQGKPVVPHKPSPNIMGLMVAPDPVAPKDADK